MTDADVREILERHLPGPLLAPEHAPPEAEYCCSDCSEWWERYGVGRQVPWPCDAYRAAEWLANRRALPTAKQLAQHTSAQTRVRTYAELFPGG